MSTQIPIIVTTLCPLCADKKIKKCMKCKGTGFIHKKLKIK
jgi:hypothetical protein